MDNALHHSTSTSKALDPVSFPFFDQLWSNCVHHFCDNLVELNSKESDISERAFRISASNISPSSIDWASFSPASRFSCSSRSRLVFCSSELHWLLGNESIRWSISFAIRGMSEANNEILLSCSCWRPLLPDLESCKVVDAVCCIIPTLLQNASASWKETISCYI